MINEKWVRGGCWDYARASEDAAFELGLDEEKDVEIVGVFKIGTNDPHHILLRLDDEYYDALGFHREDALLGIWEKHVGPVEIRSLTEDDTLRFGEDEERYEEAYEMALDDLG